MGIESKIVYTYVYRDCNEFFLKFVKNRAEQISVLIINNNLNANDNCFRDFLLELKYAGNVEIYLDVHSENNKDFYSLSSQNLKSIEDFLTLPVKKYVISDMCFGTLDCLMKNGVSGKDIFFEYKLESKIYNVFREKNKLMHEYLHAPIDDEELYNKILDYSCKIVYKPALLTSSRLGMHISKIGTSDVAVFVSRGEIDMFHLLKQKYGIDYFYELLNQYMLLGVEAIFVPYEYYAENNKWLNDVRINSVSLQQIVDKVNKQCSLIDYREDSFILGDNKYKVFTCPGGLCSHEKISVKKIYEKLLKYNPDIKIVINGCRERCISVNCDLEIVCTIGGPKVICNNSDLHIKYIEKLINGMFDEERNRTEKL